VERTEVMSRTMEAAIRLAVVAAIVAICFLIVKPFVPIVLWAIIIAVAVRPFHAKFAERMGGRGKLAATLITLAGLALVIVPVVLFAESLVGGSALVMDAVHDNALDLPPAPQWLVAAPIIGQPLDSAWILVTHDLTKALTTFAPQLKSAAGWVVSASAGLGFTALQFIVSMIIAGVFLANPAGGASLTDKLARKFAGDRSGEYAGMATGTIRSVAMGVVGVSVIQGIMAGLGMLVAGFPSAGLWALVVLIAGVAQLPVLLVLLALAAYGFKIFSTAGAIAFLIWCLITGLIDNVLKPIFFGRGSDIPMLVILIGALGGMFLFGLIGLFIGATILALGYKIFVAWLDAA